MASSGINVSEEVVNQYTKMKNDKNIKYTIFKMNKPCDTIEKGDCLLDDSKEHPEKKEEERWQQFVDSLSENECCYAVYDCAYNVQGSSKRKLAFITWAPDSANVRQKMLISSSKDALKKKFEGIQGEIQANDKDDLKFSDLISKLEKK